MKTLVVDDVGVNRRVLKSLLEKHGTCDVASGGREAVDAFQAAWKDNAPYNLICLDIMMPEFDGLMTLEVMRKIEAAMNLEPDQRVHVLIISASDTEKDQVKARELGADGYLFKPISVAALTKRLRDARLIT